MFEADNEDFLLTLFNLNYCEKKNVTQDVTQDVTQENLDAKIREMIKQNEHLSTKEMAAILGVNARTKKIEMVEANNIIQDRDEDIMFSRRIYSIH